MPIGNTDFARDFAIGANVANMAAMRQERMMQLRAQAAHQAMQERQIAAEVEMMQAHRDVYLSQVQENLKDQADMKMFGNMLRYDTEVNEVPELDATLKHLPALNAVNPRLGKIVGDATDSLLKAKAVGQPTPLDPSQVAANNARADASTASADLSRARIKDLENKDNIVIPEVKIIEGKKFLVNPKTGAVHEISKTVSKRQFIADHISSWMQNNPGLTVDDAAQNMTAFYDKFLGEGETNSPPAKSAQFIYDPQLRKLVPK